MVLKGNSFQSCLLEGRMGKRVSEVVCLQGSSSLAEPFYQLCWNVDRSPLLSSTNWNYLMGNNVCSTIVLVVILEPSLKPR